MDFLFGKYPQMLRFKGHAARESNRFLGNSAFGAVCFVLLASTTIFSQVGETAPGTAAQAILGNEWPIISEFVADHVGSDTHEYIEIFGQDRTDYTGHSLLVVDGEGNPGEILASFAIGQTGSAGFWHTGFLNDQLPDGTMTLLCVANFSATVGTDLDTNNDGNFDLTPWTALKDDVAVTDGDLSDITYSTTVLQGQTQAFLGIGFGGASRQPYGLDSDQASDWVTNDFDGEGLPGFVGTLVRGEAVNTPGMITNIQVQDYYASADLTSSTTLRNSLHDIIDDHARFPYTSSFTDTWDVLNMADEDPTNANNILSIYINASYTKQSGGNSFYNREHTWPKSYGFPDDSNNAYPYTDFHHLRLSDIDANGDRANIAFGPCNAGCNEAPTLVNNGQGGGSGMYPGNSNWYSGSSGSGNYEVWHFRRGDVARTMLYMDLRYEGDVHQIRQTLEPDLVLTDNTSLIQTTGSNTTGTAYMGRLATILQWHMEDPVDDIERRRNDIIYAFQGNRNPFVDHPEWADCIYNNNCPQQSCVSEWLAEWLNQPGPCFGGILSVQDLVAMVNGVCGCPQ